MPDQNSYDIVEMLRKKTQDADAEHFLKRSLGGYTKKSVLDYLDVLKKQQQDTAETFHDNLHTLFEEKENLKSNNDELKSQLRKLSAEYQNLSETMATYQLDNKNYSFQDIVKLKGTIAALEAEVKKVNGEKNGLMRKCEQLGDTLGEKAQELTASNQDVQLQKNLLMQEKLENKKQREIVSHLSEKIGEQQDEIQYLKGSVTEEKISELSTRVNTLLENSSKQEDVLTQVRRQMEEKENTIQAFTEENKSLKQAIERMTAASRSLADQNEKMVAANRALSSRLKELYGQTIALIGQKSDVTVEKLIVSRKLDSANRKVSMLEMEQRKARRETEAEIAAAAAQEEAESADGGSRPEAKQS